MVPPTPELQENINKLWAVRNLLEFSWSSVWGRTMHICSVSHMRHDQEACAALHIVIKTVQGTAGEHDTGDAATQYTLGASKGHALQQVPYLSFNGGADSSMQLVQLVL